MGLDFVEVVMAVEEEFGIEIPDEDIGQFHTPGHMYVYVAQRLSASRTAGDLCPNQFVFHRIRRMLTAALPIRRSDVRLDTKLESLFPLAARQDAWWQFAQHLPWIEAELGFPRAYLPTVWFALYASAIAAGAIMLGADGAGLAAAVGAPVALLLTMIVSKCPGPRRVFPHDASSVRDLVAHGVAMNFVRGELVGLRSTDNRIWNRLSRAIAVQAGVEREQVRPDSRWSDLLDC